MPKGAGRPHPVHLSEEHVTRKMAGVASLATVVATLGLATTAVSGSASADQAVGDGPAARLGPQLKDDNRPDAESRHQTALRREAVQQLVNGTAQTVGRGED